MSVKETIESLEAMKRDAFTFGDQSKLDTLTAAISLLYGASFVDNVESFAAAQAERTADANQWTARDVLVRLLRELDCGVIDIDQIFVVFDEPGGAARHACRVRDTYTAIGMLELGKTLAVQRASELS